jgi:hypothetical protein
VRLGSLDEVRLRDHRVLAPMFPEEGIVTATRSGDFAHDRAFREICEKFRALEARKAADEASANFEQAQLILDARTRLGVPVAVICEALDLSPQSVHGYRNVAERIDASLFGDLVKEHRPSGLPVFPWSIVVQIARLANEHERQDLILMIRLRGWRTRDAQGYVSVQRSEAAARQGAKLRGGSRSRGAAPVASSAEDAGRRDEENGEPGPSSIGDLAARMEALVSNAARTAPPTRVVVVVADFAARTLAEAAQEVACGRASAQELMDARDALIRCATSAFDAKNAVAERLAEASRRPRSWMTASRPCGQTPPDGPPRLPRIDVT